MDKIKELLKQLGGSEELAKQITEALETYVTEQKTLLEGDYKSKLETAKKVCLEETKRYKAELAKKVQLFFEARAERIEQQIAKQVAIRESAAEGSLKRIKGLLEGVQVNAEGEADLQAIKNQLTALQKQLKVVTEERDAAVQKANFAHGVAEKALKRNRILEAKIQPEKPVTETKETTPAPVEEKKVETPAAAPIAESVEKKPEAPKAEPQPVKKTGEQPKTAAPISEATVAKKPETPATPAPVPTGTLKSWDPTSIAAGMDD